MAIYTTADGRQIVGAAQAGNEYKGYATKRDITIQLTANGATQDSLDALEYLKAYALYANSVGKSVFPPTTNIYISNNGTTKTVEADDITVDGQNVSIGGCVWNGTAWDFTNAGQGGGGSSGGGVLVVNMVYDEEADTNYTDKTWKEIHDAPIAVIVDSVVIPDVVSTKNISLVAQVRHQGSEYSVVCYNHSKPQDKVAVDEVKLVTDSENGYLTLA